MIEMKLDRDTPTLLSGLVTALARGHVSRYPIIAENSNDSLRKVFFFDSRFYKEGKTHLTLDDVVAVLRIDYLSTGTSYELRSNRIQNNKFNRHADGFHGRVANDATRMLRLLKEHVKSYTDLEIASKSDNIKPDLTHWAEVPHTVLREIVDEVKMGQSEILNEVLHLSSLGVEFRSPKFRRIAMEGYELQLEAIRRQKAKSEGLILYVYTQPDGIVSVVHDPRVNSTTGMAKSWTYENMEAVPEVIRQQMALLNLSEPDTYVPEVGKQDENKGFWVQVPRDKFVLPEG